MIRRRSESRAIPPTVLSVCESSVCVNLADRGFVREPRAVGLLINSAHPNPLRLMPALATSDDESGQGLQMQLLRQALHAAMD